jgi:hypothetical protein
MAAVLSCFTLFFLSLRNNFAVVDIFFQEMSYQTVEQYLAYDIVALLSKYKKSIFDKIELFTGLY